MLIVADFEVTISSQFWATMDRGGWDGRQQQLEEVLTMDHNSTRHINRNFGHSGSHTLYLAFFKVLMNFVDVNSLWNSGSGKII